MSSKTNYTDYKFSAEGFETQIVIADIPTEGGLKAIFNQESLKVFINLFGENSKTWWPTFFSDGGLVTTDGSPRNGGAQSVMLQKFEEGFYATKVDAPKGVLLSLHVSALKDGDGVSIDYKGTYKYGCCQESATLLHVDSYDHKM